MSPWVGAVVLAVCLYILWQIHQVLLLALTAIIFATVLNQGVQYLQRAVPSRRGAVLVVMLTVLLVLGLFGALIVPPFLDQLQQLIALAPQAIDRVRYWLLNLETVIPSPLLQNLQGLENIVNQLRSLDLEMLFGRFLALFSNTITISLNLLLITVLALMLVADPEPYRRLFVRGFPGSVRARVKQVLERCEDSLGGWFAAVLVNMTVIALLSMVGLWILGVPLAFANGLLAGLLAFIPNLGPVLSVVPPVAIALIDTPWKALAVVILYVVIQQVESNLLTPLVMQKQVSLLPAVTLVAQVVFAVFFGFLGLLLALPLTLIIKHWLEEFWVHGVLDKR